MELVVEKTTELGVSVIRPVLTERVVTRPEGGRAAARVERWRRIAVSAAKQCGRDRVPSIAEIAPFSDALPEGGRCDLFLAGSLAPDAVPLSKALAPWRKRKPQSVAILIGPEGDLSPDELHEAANEGAVPVSFGNTTLRVETAAIFAAAVLAYEFHVAEERDG
jgi:16S rRNA (uracil1498-N3)-methyltransferase